MNQTDGDLIGDLASHPFLSGVSEGVLRRVASIAREERFGEGARVFREGESADAVYLLHEGLVALDLHVPGKGGARLETLRGGDIAGLSWLFAPFRWRLEARVIDPARATVIDAVRLREWMETDAEIGQAIAMRLVGQLYERLSRVRMQRLDLYKAGS
jgi:CRP-like cAMP-binding protein